MNNHQSKTAFVVLAAAIAAVFMSSIMLATTTITVFWRRLVLLGLGTVGFDSDGYSSILLVKKSLSEAEERYFHLMNDLKQFEKKH